ncbi:MAG TPA: hypothetical protein VF383_15240 [Candidatus Dormibacteraeota bacterium]
MGAQPQGEVALGEGAVIAQVAFDDPVGISILLGTLPPALGAGVELTVVTFIKAGAAAGGVAAALGAPRTPVPEVQQPD